MPAENEAEFDARMKEALKAEQRVDVALRGVQLDDDIAEAAFGSPYAPKPKPEPMPAYVEPRPDVPAVGALSAEALVKDFEKTAKDIEAIAADLVQASQKCAAELSDLTAKYSAMMTEIENVVAHVTDTAAAYRDEAKLVFVRIEDTTLMTEEVRRLSEEMRGRVSGQQTSSASRIPPVTFEVQDTKRGNND